MSGLAFTARGFSWRLHSGPDAIADQLRPEAARAGAKRAFVITSPSIAARTQTIARVESALGDLHAGTFSGIENDSTYRSVAAATGQARAAGADLIVAVGGGSVIVAARAVVIFLCEDGDPFQLMTQYPEGGRAHSPRLDAPKLPIINVVTTPTSAMNRAGTGLKNPELSHRMEYFDPKTRPAAILWDHQALLATPASVLRSTATTTFLGAWASVLRDEPNPLVRADREQAHQCARDGFATLAADPDSVQARLDLCAAAFLANRAEDDRAGPMLRAAPSGAFATGDYAVSTALHVRYPHVGQGEASSVLTATAIRRSPTAPLDIVRRGACALGCWREDLTAEQGQELIAATLDDVLQSAGMPTRVRQLGIARADIPHIAADTVRNFNANAGARSDEARIEESMALLEAAW